MDKNKITINTLLLSAGVLIFVFLILFKFDLSSFVSTVSDKLSWAFFILMSLLILLQFPSRGFRFHLLFNRAFQGKTSFKDSFILTGASFFVALATPNRLGEATRGLFFKEKAVEITAVTFIEYLADTLTLACIAFLGLLLVYQQYLSKFILALAIVIAALAVPFYLLKYGKAKKLIIRFNCYQKIHNKVQLLKSHIAAGIKNKFVLPTAFVFSCLFNAVYFLVFYLVLCRLGATVSITDVFFSAGVGRFIGTLTFIPMGMGTRDASIYGLLCSIGTAPEIAISSVIIMRSFTIPLLLVSSACYFLAINRFANKK